MRYVWGFTLIEVLISIAILSVIMGVSVNSYRDFQAGQELEQAAQTLRTNLRFAQSQAFGGVKPTACTTTLIGWYARTQNGSTQYTINYRCGDGSKGEVRQHEQYRAVKLVQDMTIVVSPNRDILFQPVNRDTVFLANAEMEDPPFSAGTDFVITLRKNGKDKIVTVRSNGDIL